MVTGLLAYGMLWQAAVPPEEAVRRLFDPAEIRKELADLTRARAAGELTDEEADALEQALRDRLAGHGRAP
ncbi:gas vesicle protein GvpG [Actinocorallia sp. A-T 12471]|uniref:gas vesicle protein GvpG n=1 Tax=Actinocorallia sp. A-T 12471 TaxID=3089813 RepID=UPI0029CD46D6|nr:hypothetical protein [Actinocorallia sp. A-T 12471]MDX6742193.1 hypothetical protein [Actinocorallia sp. A-T 12471]